MKAGGKGLWGWMSFDWANQPFHTVITTFVFGPYFASRVAENVVVGQEIWGYAIAAGSVLMALSAPVLGSVADAQGPRKPWILAFSLIYLVGVTGLWLATPGMDDPLTVLVLLAVALIGAEIATVFVNSILPEVGPHEELGRISGSGWAFGYWGGLVALVIVLGLMTPAPGSDRTMLGIAPVFGLDAAQGEGARATGPFSALWYAVFMVPFFLWSPDVKRRAGATADAVREGLQNLKQTLAGLPSRPSLLAYLLASMFYRDAILGIGTFGGIYASGVLGWGLFEIGVFGLVILVSGAFGAWAGGLQDVRRGPKPVILFNIVALTVATAAIMTIAPHEVLFLTVGTAEAPSSLPMIAFYVCGAVIGATAGSLQAASRTMLVHQADRERMAEAFGLYALTGKATSFIAPFLVALATGLSGSQRVGVVPILALLAIGLVLMAWVRPEGDRREA